MDLYYNMNNEELCRWLEQKEAFLSQFSSGEEPILETNTPLLSINRNYNQKLEDTITSTRHINYSINPVNLQSPSQALPMNTIMLNHSKDNNLRSIMEIPEYYRSIFSYPYFNRMQSEAMDKVLYTDENVVIAAPTGAGKTVLMELAMIRCFINNPHHIKIIYMAPTKSLCSERVRDWKEKWSPFGIACNEFTGDTTFINMDHIRDSHIIVTTPEKWDVMTRRWVDHKKLIQLIKLIMIDEVHILREPRGATLEACISRMKVMKHKLRYVATSATLPNLQDIANWLNATPLEFSEEYRPIPLDRYVYGYPCKSSLFSFEKTLDWKLLNIIEKHSNNKPVLVFCSTRKSAESTCETLLKLMSQNYVDSLRNIFLSFTTSSTRDTKYHKCKSKKLSTFIQHGIGFHHAGLDTEDRQLVEKLFLEKHIRVIATTSTLAIGVNLPAHLVIIKSTKRYQNCKMIEYSDIDVLQMMGRAGRPGLDTSGCAVIMTTMDMEYKYKLLITCQSTIESSLHHNLIEHLLSEVCLGTVIDIESGIKWLKSTFLYTRVERNPFFYQLDDGINSKEPDKIMQNNNLVSISKNPQSKGIYISTFYGEKMDRYCIKFDTMTKIMRHDNWISIKDVLELVCQAQEFEINNRFNANERPFLNELRKNSSIRFILKDKVSNVSERIFLLIQCVLGDIYLYHGIIECGVFEKNGLKVKHSLDLYSSLQAKMWSTSQHLLKQVEYIGTSFANILAKNGINTFQDLLKCDPGYIEMILHRNPPIGTKIKNALAVIPQFNLDVQINENDSFANSSATISFSVTISLLYTPNFKKMSKYGKGYHVVLWIETNSHYLIDFKKILIHQLVNTPQKYEYKVKADSANMSIKCQVQSEDYVGLQVSKELKSKSNKKYFKKSATNSSALCKHTCKNKHICKHQCCKKGLDLVIINGTKTGIKRIRDDDDDDTSHPTNKKGISSKQQLNNKTSLSKPSSQQLFTSPKNQRRLSFSPLNLDPWEIPDNKMLDLLFDMTSGTTNFTTETRANKKSFIPSTSSPSSSKLALGQQNFQQSPPLQHQVLQQKLSPSKNIKDTNFKKNYDYNYLSLTQFIINMNNNPPLSKFEKSLPLNILNSTDNHDPCDWLWEKLGDLIEEMNVDAKADNTINYTKNDNNSKTETLIFLLQKDFSCWLPQVFFFEISK
ncbi:hypothetical protein BJ944DRAFT_232258 [Cunninghamella echinulata]|nr:hypothetical protein BJ944DRAFT_232258 [Cunninghamella echinulata]